MDLKIKTISEFTVKSEDDNVYIEGWGAVYNNIDSYKDVLMPGCARKSIEERGTRVKLCNQHDMRAPVGKFTKLEERTIDGKSGIWFEAMISKSEPGIATKIKEGILNEFSIGYSELRSEKGDWEGEKVSLVQEIKLYEISVVTVAANDQAVLTRVKEEQHKDIINSFDELIKNVKNDDTKFELLKLKGLTLAAITPESNPPDKPEPFTKEDAIKLLRINNN